MKLASFLAVPLILFCSVSAWAGPPFQTDDPEPIDYKNYEFYTFASADGTAVEMDTAGPAAEFNWGALPNVHLHIIVPLAAILPSNNPSFAPAGTGPSAVGLGDIETGIKYPLRAGNQAPPADRHVRHVRASDRQRRERTGRGQHLVQSAALGAEEFRAVDHVWRRRRDALQPRGRLSQLSRLPAGWCNGTSARS